MTTTRKFSDWVASYRNGYGKRPAAGESGPIVLRIADVSSGVIDLTNPRRGIVPEKEAKTYRLQQGDLVFVRVNGAREIVGRCCVVGPEVPADTIFNDHLIRVRLVPEVDPEFARLCVSVPAARAVIEEAASTSAGQLSISQQVLDSIDVPDLPYNRQCEIAARVRAQLAEVAVARHAAQAQLREIEALPRKILARALDS
jgi:type I restriction enzyme S subunit